MQKLKSFDQFATEAKNSQTRHLEEEKIVKRTNEAEAFKALLSEFKVASIKELTEEQRSEFFNRLRGAEINEAVTLIEEGTRGQFGKIDKKGNITSIYTHYDSYPENMLPIIKKSFKNSKSVDAVIAKGDCSGLEDSIDKMNFYGDSGKPSTGNVSNVSKYLRDVADGGGAEYVYLWDEANKEWLMADIYGKGYDDLYPAFESVSVSVNEAIQVKYKRDAKKVVTVYNNLFAKKLTDLGAMSNESVLGCIKYLFENAMEDANFSREGFVISKNIKGSIGTFEVKMPGLGNHFIKIGATTVKRILDKYYSDIANAAGWSGIGIVEGTALYLEQLKQEAMGQSLLNAFNGFFNESLVIENADILCEATVEMDAMDPDNKDFLKFLKKNRVEIISKEMQGPGGGTPVITMQGKRKDLEAVLADGEYGWDDPDLAEYIEESVVTEKLSKSELNKIEDFLYDQDADTLRDICDDLLMDDEDYTENKYDLDSDDLVGMAMDYIDSEGIELKDVKAMVESVVSEAKSFSQSELESMAQVIADATAKVDKTKAKVVNFEMLDTPGRIAGFYIHKATNKLGAPSRYWITDSGEVVKAFRYDTFGPEKGTVAEVGDKLADVVKTFKANESVVSEATVEVDATDPKSKDLKKLLKKNNVDMKIITMDGPGGGWPLVELSGDKKDLIKVLADCDYGWCDEDMEEFIEEANGSFKTVVPTTKDRLVSVNEAEVKSDEEFNEYATTVLQKAFGEEFDEAKAKKVIDGILAKSKGDYGVAVGMLTSSLG